MGQAACVQRLNAACLFSFEKLLVVSTVRFPHIKNPKKVNAVALEKVT